MADKEEEKKHTRFNGNDNSDLIDEIGDDIDEASERKRLLRKTQRVRERILDRWLEGEVLDDDETRTVLEVTKGIDKQEVDKERIAIAKKDSNSNAAMARALEETLRRIEDGAVKMPPPKTVRRDPINSDFLAPISDAVVNSGELSETGKQETVDDFMGRMEND